MPVLQKQIARIIVQSEADLQSVIGDLRDNEKCYVVDTGVTYVKDASIVFPVSGPGMFSIDGEVDFTTAEPAGVFASAYINTVTGASSGTAQAVVATEILMWNGTDWSALTPWSGMFVFNSATNVHSYFDGTGWVIATGNASAAISPASNNAIGAIGTSVLYARQDHKHPAQQPSSDVGNSIGIGTDGLSFLDGSVYVEHTEVVDNLTSTSTTNPLSAYQGKILQDQITGIGSDITVVADVTARNALTGLTLGHVIHVENDAPDNVGWARYQVTSAGDGTWAGATRVLISSQATSSITGMQGATAIADGSSGTVPKPVAGDQAKYLRGDASWQDLVVPAAGSATAKSTDVAGAGGSSAQYARADHRHGAQTPSVDAGNIISVGTDGLHYAASGGGATPATVISPASTDAVGAVGTSTNLARQDHKHPAQAVSTDASNALSNGTDGRAFLNTSSAPSPATVVSPAATATTGTVGTATKYAREDHKHPAQAVSTDASNALSNGTDGRAFLNTSSAPSPATVAPVTPTGNTSTVGVATKYAREDHRHAAQPVSANAGNKLSAGTDGLHLLKDFVGDAGAGGQAGTVPAPAAGDAAGNKYLKANGTWSAIAGGATTFVGLTDTPGSMGGYNGYITVVNSAATALEFVASAPVPPVQALNSNTNWHPSYNGKIMMFNSNNVGLVLAATSSGGLALGESVTVTCNSTGGCAFIQGNNSVGWYNLSGPNQPIRAANNYKIFVYCGDVVRLRYYSGNVGYEIIRAAAFRRMMIPAQTVGAGGKFNYDISVNGSVTANGPYEAYTGTPYIQLQNGVWKATANIYGNGGVNDTFGFFDDGLGTQFTPGRYRYNTEYGTEVEAILDLRRYDPGRQISLRVTSGASFTTASNINTLGWMQFERMPF